MRTPVMSVFKHRDLNAKPKIINSKRIDKDFAECASGRTKKDIQMTINKLKGKTNV